MTREEYEKLVDDFGKWCQSRGNAEACGQVAMAETRASHAEVARTSLMAAFDEMQPPSGNPDQPLSVEVTESELVTRIGINVVQFAAENMESNNPFDDDLNDFKRLWVITDPLEFTKGVAHALTDKAEDGSTPLILLLDKMCLAAIEASIKRAVKEWTGVEIAERQTLADLKLKSW